MNAATQRSEIDTPACLVAMQGDTLTVQHRQSLMGRLMGVPFLLFGGWAVFVASLLVWSHVQAGSFITDIGRWLPGWLGVMAFAACMLWVGFKFSVATRWVALRITDGHITHALLRDLWLRRTQHNLRDYAQVRLVARSRKLGKGWPQDAVVGQLGPTNLKLVLVPRAAMRARGMVDPDFDSLANAPPWEPIDPNSVAPSLVLAEGDLEHHAALRDAGRMLAAHLRMPFHHRVPMCLVRWKKANPYKNF